MARRYCPIDFQLAGVDAAIRQFPELLRHLSFNLPLHVGFGHRKIVIGDELIHQLILGFLLREVLTFQEDGLADGFPEVVQLGVITKVLGKLVVEFRQFFSPDHLQLQAKADGLAGKPLLSIVFRIGDLEFLLFFR